MGREIRRVPENWEHPKSSRGAYKPLMDNYINSLAYWKEEVEEFISKMTEIITTGKATPYKEEFTDVKKLYNYYMEDGGLNPPNIENYMPMGEWYQLYENVSEGTPLSPPFKTKQELAEWLTNNLDFWEHQWTKNQAEGIVELGFSPSGIMVNGGFYGSEEAVDIAMKLKESK